MTIPTRFNRRRLLIASAAGAVALGAAGPATAAGRGAGASVVPDDKMLKRATGAEDLMREHGVLRRALLVYHVAAKRLREAPESVPAEQVFRTATLFRTFGEDYHERRLEEAYVFPVLRKTKGPVAAYPDILVKQHNRGREVTDLIVNLTAKGKVGTGDAPRLASALDAMVRMYEQHAAREDTVVFPAWKAALSGKQYVEMGGLFDDIAHRLFGADGFGDAVKTIAAVEDELGLANLDQFTVSPVPTAQP